MLEGSANRRVSSMDFDTEVKLAVYRDFASTGKAPPVARIASELARSTEEIREAFVRLQRNRVLLLEADGESIRMAPPFSGVPTQHRVEIGRQLYSANCAWDALGIPAALHREAVVHSSCGQSGVPLRLHVGLEGPEPSAWLFHCQVPAARWWEDLVFT
jgi:Alkylmercury lyase